MQVNNQAMTSQMKPHDKPLELKQGEIYRATVKERGSDNEAILQIRGKEVSVKFEGNLPSQERITVQISGQTGQLVQVKEIAEAPKATTTPTTQAEASNINQALRNLGVNNPTPELRQAAQMILDKGVPLSKESVQDLRTFLEKEKGTIEQRLNTVQAVANKRLDVTTNHLRAVHEALHGRPLNEVLTNIAKGIDPNFRTQQEQSTTVRKESQSSAEPRAVENRLASERPVSDQVRAVREQVQREPNIQRSIEQVRSEVVNNPRVDKEFSQQVNRALDEARALQQSGREVAARERIVQALKTAEQEIARTEPKAQAEPRVTTEQREVGRTDSRPAPERPVSDQVRTVREQVQREPNVQRSIEQVRSEVVNNPRVDKELSQQVNRAVEEAKVLQESGREVAARERIIQALQTVERVIARTEPKAQAEPRAVENRPAPERPVSEQVRAVREQVQREPSVQRSIEQVRNEVVNNPRVDKEVSQQVNRAVEEAKVLQESGREVAARERIVQALQSAEREIARTEPKAQAEPRAVESRPAPERPVSEQVRAVREQVQREPNVQRSIEQVRSELMNNANVDKSTVQHITKAFNEAQTLIQSGREGAARTQLIQSLVNVEKTLSVMEQKQVQQNQTLATPQLTEEQIRPTEALKQMQATVQKEADFPKALNEVKRQIEKAPFEQQTKELLSRSLQEATKLHEQGRELAARQQLMQALTAVEPQVASREQAIKPETQQYVLNEAFQTQQLSSKDFIVQTITEKLAKAQADFKSFQREMTRNLDNIQRLTEAFKSQAINQVKPLLETTIKKLDNTILKSEMMLFTDMKTEKNLMQASSQLAEAKKLLSKGNYQEANKIVQEVKTMVEKLEFKPSETKVKHFITKEEQNLQNRPAPQQLLQQFDEMTRRSAATQDFSARQAFELVRGLGLNRDSEVAQMLASGKHGDDEPNQNMKNALMQLAKIEEEQGRPSQQTSQALANITGQQLLSKSDTSSNLQSMFFNLPILLEDDVKNLQVFVNSRNEGQQVDWENCNLYFLIETKKLGEVGILVTATDRNLSLTIKNDQPFFKEKIQPLAELCKNHLKEVGYNVASLNFTKLNTTKAATTQTDSEEEEGKMTPMFTEKGFDFKI